MDEPTCSESPADLNASGDRLFCVDAEWRVVVVVLTRRTAVLRSRRYKSYSLKYPESVERTLSRDRTPFACNRLVRLKIDPGVVSRKSS